MPHATVAKGGKASARTHEVTTSGRTTLATNSARCGIPSGPMADATPIATAQSHNIKVGAIISWSHLALLRGGC